MGKRKVDDPVAAAAAAEVDEKAAKKRAKKEKKAAKKAKKAKAEDPVVAAAAVDEDDKAAKKRAKKEKKAAKKAAKAAAAGEASPAKTDKAAEKAAKKAAKKAKKAAKKAKKAADSGDDSSDASADAGSNGAAAEATEAAAPETPSKPAAAAEGNPANNPEGITRVFVGNLSWDIEEEPMRKFAEPGVITDIHWVTKKETGEFQGRGFLEFETAAQAGEFLKKNGQELLGREIRIDLAQPRQAKAGGAGARSPRPLSEKPVNCTTVFLGNLSFDIEEATINELCSSKGIAAPVNIRWLTDRDSGAFKGCGFVEFAETASVDEFVKLNGEDLLGRSLRVDYAEGRKNTPRAGGGARGRTPQPLGEKPEGCTTVFLGNLSYDIEDDDVHAKAKEVGCGDVKHIRWLTDRESGDFKGCGFVEFYDTADVDKFATLNGADVKGRSMRVDFAKPRAPRE